MTLSLNPPFELICFGTSDLSERLFEASSQKGAPRLLEENLYHSGWRPPRWGRFENSETDVRELPWFSRRETMFH